MSEHDPYAGQDGLTPVAEEADEGVRCGGHWPLGATWTACVLLVAGTIAAYSNTLRSPFVFDDDINITDNDSIRQFWPVWQIFEKSSRDGVPVRSRPLVNLSLAVNYAAGGFDPLYYHLTNVAIHVLAGLVLFGLVRKTLALPNLRERYGAAATPLAFVIAAAWAIHPLQTQAVTYVIQRCESMMGLFFLLTLYCVVSSESSLRARRWEAAAVLACLASMGCKEVAVTAPLVILLYDRAFLAGSFRETWKRRRGMYVGLGACWIVFGLLLLWSGGPVPSHGTTAGAHPCSPVEYARSQFGVILHYLRLSFWPYPQVFDYAWPVAHTASEIVPGGLVAGGLLAATVFALIRWPKWGTLGAWFFLILAPTSSIVPILDLAFEHRMYLSLAAVVAAAAITAYEATTWLAARFHMVSWGWIVTQAVPALAVLGALGAATYARNQVYRTASSLWSDVVQKVPTSARGYANLGLAFDREGQLDKAVAACCRALELAPGYPLAHYNLATLVAQQGKVDAAIAEYKKALEGDPRSVRAHYNLANCLAGQGRLDEAVLEYRKALDVRPQFVDARYNLANALKRQGKLDEAIVQYQETLEADQRFANAYVGLADALSTLGKLDEAAAQCRKAVEIAPRSAESQHNLASILARQGRLDEAIGPYEEALKINPAFLQARMELGRVLYLQGKNREAAGQWGEAVRSHPDDIRLLNAVAWEWATCPNDLVRNGVDAVRLAERAVQLSANRSAELLDTEGAAYAETGRFSQAVAAAQAALELATALGDAALAQALRARIKLYQSGVAFRDARSPLARGPRSGVGP